VARTAAARAAAARGGGGECGGVGSINRGRGRGSIFCFRLDSV